MSTKSFITIEELREMLHAVITKNALPYDVSLIMEKIEEKASSKSFKTFIEMHLIKIEGYKILVIRGQLINEEVKFNHVFFQNGPIVFLGQQFSL